MARKMPTAAEYRNAQRVTGMKDVDIADVRDITRRGLKAPVPVPVRKRVKTKTKPKVKPRLITVNKPKAKPAPKPQPTPAQKVAQIPAAKPNNGTTAEELDVIGRAGKNPTPPPPPVKQKVKVDEHGGMSANDAPTPKPIAKSRAARAAIGGAGLTAFTSTGTALAHKTRQGHNALSVLINGVPPKWAGQNYRHLSGPALASFKQGWKNHVLRHTKTAGALGLGATAVGAMADYMEKKHPKFPEIYEEVHKKVRGKGNT